MKSYDGKSLCELSFEGQKYFNEKKEAARRDAEKKSASAVAEKFAVAEISSHKAHQTVEKSLLIFSETKRWLDVYFSGTFPDFMPPLDLRGTDFRMEVWHELLKIPYGKTVSYGDIAAKLARKKGIEKMSSRAVGGAVGHNPVAIIVPCHRVVGTNGSLTGYGGGIERKVKLLQLEGVDMTQFFLPKKGTAL